MGFYLIHFWYLIVWEKINKQFFTSQVELMGVHRHRWINLQKNAIGDYISCISDADACAAAATAPTPATATPPSSSSSTSSSSTTTTTSTSTTTTTTTTTDIYDLAQLTDTSWTNQSTWSSGHSVLWDLGCWNLRDTNDQDLLPNEPSFAENFLHEALRSPAHPDDLKDSPLGGSRPAVENFHPLFLIPLFGWKTFMPWFSSPNIPKIVMLCFLFVSVPWTRRCCIYEQEWNDGSRF